MKIGAKLIVDKALKYFFRVLLVLLCITYIVPVLWMMMNSLKGPLEYYLKPTYAAPDSWINFSSYKYFFEHIQYTVSTDEGKMLYTLPWMFYYSLLWAILPSVWSVTLSFMSAYVIAKYRFPGRSFLYSLGIIVMILPIVGSTGSMLLVRKSLGIYNNMWLTALTMPACAFSGMQFLAMYAAFKGIPWDYAEAVFIDGGGHLRVFTTIMLPMALPSGMVFVLLNFIAYWNDYSTFLFWLPRYANLARGIYNYQYDGRISMGASIPDILAGFVVVSIPIVILYASVQKVITSNFVVGGLKG